MSSTKPIVIESFLGGPAGADLKGCYFVETAHHEFELYAPDNTPIPTTPSPVSKGPGGFKFTYQGWAWTISDFLISDSVELANGSWSAVPQGGPGVEPSPTGDDPETGTFQAQGGPGTDHGDD